MGRQPRQSPVTRSSSSFGLIKRSRTNAPEDSKSMALLKRLSWSIRDKDRFEILVTDLRELNDGLCSILPIQTQVSYRQALNAAVLSGTDDSSKLAAIEQAAEPEYPDIANAARLRAATLGIEEGFQNQLATLQLKLPRGSVKFLAGRMASSDDVQMLGPDISGKCREFALYQGTQHGSTPSIGSSTVVVEWKPYDFQAAGAKAFSIALRADGLARLLQSSAGQADLRMLPLIGYIDDLPEARFGFIFQCPTPRLFGFPNKVKSLNWILTSSPKLPALELRFRLAQNLAKTLFAFHCAQWLHKDFSSHNIVFASRIGATEEVDSADLARPFVLGFKYSRPEDHEGLSSEIRAHESDETHLYQHPKLSALESQNSVPRYCRMFDIYALGCVLLELGLWRPLRSLWKPRYRKEPGNWRTKLVETWATELRGRCGTQYEEVVRYCLRMDEMAGSLEADELSRFCWEIVAKLQELKV